MPPPNGEAGGIPPFLQPTPGDGSIPMPPPNGSEGIVSQAPPAPQAGDAGGPGTPPLAPPTPDEGALVAMRPPVLPPTGGEGAGNGPGRPPLVPPSSDGGVAGFVPPFVPPQPEPGAPPLTNPRPYYPPNRPGGGYPNANPTPGIGYGIPPLAPPTPSVGVDWYPYPGYEGYPETAHGFYGGPADQYRGPRIVPVVMPRRTHHGTEVYAHRYDPPRIHRQHANGVGIDNVHRLSGPGME